MVHSWTWYAAVGLATLAWAQTPALAQQGQRTPAAPPAHLQPPRAQVAPHSAPLPDWYVQAQATWHVNWSLLAALDVYGATTKPQDGVTRRKGLPRTVLGFRFRDAEWSGLNNPLPNDQNATRIALFDGLGVDGDHDGRADIDNPYDRVAGIARWLASEGPTEQDAANVLWNYFQNPVAVERVQALAHVYAHFRTLQLDDRTFPLVRRYDYSFKDTWGEGRSFGGRRMHEGTDLFAGYGTPVVSVCYGYVELIGWNRLGGWRIGLRAADNTYYYYAHLSSYTKGLKQGHIVAPGEVIGYVGSSGYGRPGTSGKFPPHLHFGVYKDTGNEEWATDPYPLLRRWERRPQHVTYPTRLHPQRRHTRAPGQ